MTGLTRDEFRGRSFVKHHAERAAASGGCREMTHACSSCSISSPDGCMSSPGSCGSAIRCSSTGSTATCDPSARGAPELYGDIWLLHSGGFYFVEKTCSPASRMPRPLHWFKWQAYTTWLSGVALLLVVYYAGGRALLTDPSKVAHSRQASRWPSGSAAIVVGWLVYDMRVARSSRRALRDAGAAHRRSSRSSRSSSA